mmetsp:Transcript_9857/g.18580  ORF Transcript_9857/g.18580 Transcript_9857/m.18580 type:complete len:498 (+) Transcript_9857:561-2054(+)
MRAEDAVALVGSWKSELHHLVHAVQNCLIQVAWSICRQNQPYLGGLVACPRKQRVHRRTQTLASALPASHSQERVGLVNEEQHALLRGLRPVEELVQPRHRVRTQGRHVASSHDGKVKPRVLGQLSSGERLARAGRTVEHGVLERGAVLLVVGGCGCQLTNASVQPWLQHHLPQPNNRGEAAGGSNCGSAGPRQGVQRSLGGFSDKGRLPQIALQQPGTKLGTLPRAVDAHGQRGDAPHQQAQLGGVCKELARTSAHVVEHGVDHRQCLLLLRLEPHQHLPPVHVLVLAVLLDAAFGFKQGFLAQGLALNLGHLLRAFLPLRLDLLLHYTPMHLLPLGGLFLHGHQLRVALPILLVLRLHALSCELVLVSGQLCLGLRLRMLRLAHLLPVNLLALHFGLLGIVHVFCFLFFILCQLCLLLLLGKLKHRLGMRRAVDFAQCFSTSLKSFWIKLRWRRVLSAEGDGRCNSHATRHSSGDKARSRAERRHRCTQRCPSRT